MLRPSPEGWPCRSKQPADGSTRPRQRCSRAVLRAGRLLRLLLEWPEELLALGDKQDKPVRATPSLSRWIQTAGRAAKHPLLATASYQPLHFAIAN